MKLLPSLHVFGIKVKAKFVYIFKIDSCILRKNIYCLKSFLPGVEIF